MQNYKPNGRHCISFEELTNQARSLHAARENATQIDLSFTAAYNMKWHALFPIPVQGI